MQWFSVALLCILAVELLIVLMILAYMSRWIAQRHRHAFVK